AGQGGGLWGVTGAGGFGGRERELSCLEGALGGEARLVLVGGDAGVGKTGFGGGGMRRAAAGGGAVPETQPARRLRMVWATAGIGVCVAANGGAGGHLWHADRAATGPWVACPA